MPDELDAMSESTGVAASMSDRSVDQLAREDLPRRQNGGRHLIEQRLKEMMIGAVDQNDVDRSPAQCLGSCQSRKSAANDYVSWYVHTRVLLGEVTAVNKEQRYVVASSADRQDV